MVENKKNNANYIYYYYCYYIYKLRFEKSEISGNNSSEEVKEDETRLIDDAGLIVKYENRFKEYLPNMKIVAKEMADLDYLCKSRALGAEKVQPSQEISSFPNIQPILIHICINSEL